MNCLVTGASGFVGANLVEAIGQKGWRARAMHRNSSSLKALEGLRYESAIGDVNAPETLAEAMHDIDFVFHVAAVAEYWRVGKDKLYHVNVEGTRNVLQAALDGRVKRVVFTSSAAALGQPAFGSALDESAQFNLRPEQFYYGHSKHRAEQVVREFADKGLDVVILNPAIILGPRDVHQISGSLVTLAAKHGLPFYPSGGICVIDVADVCAAHLAAAEVGVPSERYILGAENLSYAELFTMITQVVGKPVPRLRIDGPLLRAGAIVVDGLRDLFKLPLPVNGDQLRFSAETLWFYTDKMRNDLGIKPRSAYHMITRTYDWYRANGVL